MSCPSTLTLSLASQYQVTDCPVGGLPGSSRQPGLVSLSYEQVGVLPREEPEGSSREAPGSLGSSLLKGAHL